MMQPGHSPGGEIMTAPLTQQGRIEQSQAGRAGHGRSCCTPQHHGESRPWVPGTLQRDAQDPDHKTPLHSFPLPIAGAGSDVPPIPQADPRGAPAVPGQSSLLLAGGELADLAAGGAGLAGGVGGGAGPALALGPGAQLPRLRPVHAHGLGQPLAAALPVLPGLLLRHLSCKGTATVRCGSSPSRSIPFPAPGMDPAPAGKAEPVPPSRSTGERS